MKYPQKTRISDFEKVISVKSSKFLLFDGGENVFVWKQKQIFDTALTFKCMLSKAESRIERDFIFYS